MKKLVIASTLLLFTAAMSAQANNKAAPVAPASASTVQAPSKVKTPPDSKAVAKAEGKKKKKKSATK